MSIYAGIQTEPCGPVERAWIDANVRLEDIHLPPWRSWAYQVGLSTLYWPVGAKRWGECWLVASKRQVDAMRASAYAGGTYQARQLRLDDGKRIVLADMWMLTPKPLNHRREEKGLWLVPLVDDRYWWWLRTTNDLVPGESWAALISGLAGRLGVPITHSAIHADYGNPPPGMVLDGEPVPVALDRIAGAIQRVLVRGLDGTVEFLSAEESEARVTAELYKARPVRVGGQGELGPGDLAPVNDSPTVVPRGFVFHFPEFTDQGLWNGSLREVEVSLADAAPGRSGLQPHNDYAHFYPPARAVLDEDDALTNGDALRAYAVRYAADWLRRQLIAHDFRLDGIQFWQCDGVSRLEWRADLGDRSTRVSTRTSAEREGAGGDPSGGGMDMPGSPGGPGTPGGPGGGGGGNTIINNYYIQQLIQYINYYTTIINPSGAVAKYERKFKDTVSEGEYGRWYFGGEPERAGEVTLTGGAETPDLLWALPFLEIDGRQVKDLAYWLINNNTGGKVRIGIYNNTADGDPYPNSLIWDSGELDASIAGNIGLNTVDFCDSLQPYTLYWLAFICDDGGSPIQIKHVSVSELWCLLGHDDAWTSTKAGSGWYISQTYGALPATFPAGADVIDADLAPAVGVRYGRCCLPEGWYCMDVGNGCPGSAVFVDVNEYCDDEYLEILPFICSGPHEDEATALAECPPPEPTVEVSCCVGAELPQDMYLHFSVASGTYACADATTLTLTWNAGTSQWEWSGAWCSGGTATFAVYCLAGAWKLGFDINGDCVEAGLDADTFGCDAGSDTVTVDWSYSNTCFFGTLNMTFDTTP